MVADVGQEIREVRVPVGQFQTLRALLVDGADNRTIARRLNVSEHTVKTQLRRLYENTGYHSKSELICALARREVRVVPISPGERGYRRPTNPAFWPDALR